MTDQANHLIISIPLIFVAVVMLVTTISCIVYSNAKSKAFNHCMVMRILKSTRYHLHTLKINDNAWVVLLAHLKTCIKPNEHLSWFHLTDRLDKSLKSADQKGAHIQIALYIWKYMGKVHLRKCQSPASSLIHGKVFLSAVDEIAI